MLLLVFIECEWCCFGFGDVRAAIARSPSDLLHCAPIPTPPVAMQLEQERARSRQLQEDYAYNLALLEEKERELRRYDVAYAEARQVR